MENSIIDALDFINKILSFGDKTLSDEQKKIMYNITNEQKRILANILYYYTKACDNNSDNHRKLLDVDIETISNENKIIKDNIDIIKSCVQKLKDSQNIINRLTT